MPDSARRGRGDGSVLTDVVCRFRGDRGGERRWTGICNRLCKSLVFVVGATACSASRVVGDFLVDATEHALREVWLGDAAAYRISDFPLTAETLRTNQPRAVSFLGGDVEPAEAFILRELAMNALLMLPLHVGGTSLGAGGALRDAASAVHRGRRRDRAVPHGAGRAPARGGRGGGGTPSERPPVYELPSADVKSWPGLADLRRYRDRRSGVCPPGRGEGPRRTTRYSRLVDLEGRARSKRSRLDLGESIGDSWHECELRHALERALAFGELLPRVRRSAPRARQRRVRAARPLRASAPPRRARFVRRASSISPARSRSSRVATSRRAVASSDSRRSRSLVPTRSTRSTDARESRRRSSRRSRSATISRSRATCSSSAAGEPGASVSSCSSGVDA